MGIWKTTLNQKFKNSKIETNKQKKKQEKWEGNRLNPGKKIGVKDKNYHRSEEQIAKILGENKIKWKFNKGNWKRQKNNQDNENEIQS